MLGEETRVNKRQLRDSGKDNANSSNEGRISNPNNGSSQDGQELKWHVICQWGVANGQWQTLLLQIISNAANDNNKTRRQRWQQRVATKNDSRQHDIVWMESLALTALPPTFPLSPCCREIDSRCNHPVCLSPCLSPIIRTTRVMDKPCGQQWKILLMI